MSKAFRRMTIAALAFADGPLLAAAKVGILAGSGLSGVAGLILGRRLYRSRG